jgi:hypothetical protein
VPARRSVDEVHRRLVGKSDQRGGFTQGVAKPNRFRIDVIDDAFSIPEKGFVYRYVGDGSSETLVDQVDGRLPWSAQPRSVQIRAKLGLESLTGSERTQRDYHDENRYPAILRLHAHDVSFPLLLTAAT